MWENAELFKQQQCWILEIQEYPSQSLAGTFFLLPSGAQEVTMSVHLNVLYLHLLRLYLGSAQSFLPQNYVQALMAYFVGRMESKLLCLVVKIQNIMLKDKSSSVWCRMFQGLLVLWLKRTKPRVTAQQNLVSWKTLRDFPESRVDTLTRRSRAIQNQIE